MIIASVILLLFVLEYFVYATYLKEYVDVTVIYKALRKLLASRDVMVLRIIPEVPDKKISEKILNLINVRSKASKLSYDEAIKADIELHNELKKLYDVIDKMDKNELQREIFKKIINYEKSIKIARIRYSEAVERYNMSLTIHPNFCIKVLHMRPLEMYGTKNK